MKVINRATDVWEDEGGATMAPLDRVGPLMTDNGTDPITAGSVLIEEGAPLPNPRLLQTESYVSGWALVSDRSTFEKDVEKAGWTFFFMAGEIKTTVFGFDRQKALRTALKRLIANVKSQNCNSIQIQHALDKSFLGAPYVNVVAHARHLQRGLVFSRQRNSI